MGMAWVLLRINISLLLYCIFFWICICIFIYLHSIFVHCHCKCLIPILYVTICFQFSIASLVILQKIPDSSLPLLSHCFSAIVFLVTFWSKISYAYRWKGDQMFYLLAKFSFAYLLPVSLQSLCFSVLPTKRQCSARLVQ